MFLSRLVRGLAIDGNSCVRSCRCFSSNVGLGRSLESMSAWHQHEYGSKETLYFSKSSRIPPLRQPNDVLVEVHGASVNPIDCKMLDGYGSTLLNAVRCVKQQKNRSEFPLTVGRDFSGVVVDVGKGVTSLRPGAEVWGTVDATRQGSFAEYTVVSADHLSRKPENLSHIEAASFPYVATTTWNALCTFGGLSDKNTVGKRVLVYGGSGGIGTFALQLLQAWGAHITTTCSADASGMCIMLGADVVIDYTKEDFNTQLQKLEKFDFILDSVGEHYPFSMELLKPNGMSRYVTIRIPLLKNADDHGLMPGLFKSGVTLFCNAAKGFTQGKHYRWALYQPNGKALQTITRLVEEHKIVPVIDKVFKFDELVDAVDKVSTGKARGKTVIDVKGTSVDTDPD